MANAQDIGLFDNYTSTQDLSFVDSEEMTEWSGKYFDHYMLPLLPKKKTASILEIGCGWGKYLSHLKKSGYKNAEGIDISPEQIAYARKQLKLKNVTLADGLKFLKTSKKKYDAIYMIDVLEHLDLEDSIEIGKLIYKSLNKNGVFFFQVPNGVSLMTPIRYADITHTRAYSDYMCTQYMKLAGFDTASNYALPPMPHGLKSMARSILWNTLVNPLIKGYMMIANGTTMGGIYTSNILSAARK
jgi:2-polyprenyl-3-methyl-5-hydroxy-6-metoxy-1,4-benzoquinol methylase